MVETFTVRMLSNFVKLDKGDLAEVREHPDNPAVYISESVTGPFYIPKAITEKVEEKKPKERMFDPEKTMTPPPASEEMSLEELSVLQSVTTGLNLKKPAKDGPTTDTSFVKKVLTVEEKKAAVNGAKVKAMQDRLDFKGTPLLQEGQFWLTDLTGGELPDSGVNHIITCHSMTCWIIDGSKKWVQTINTGNPWYNSMSLTDIPEIDENYLWNANVLEAIVISYKLNEKALLTGPPGTGKTSAIRQFAAWTDHPYMRFNGKDGIEQSSFLGYVTVIGGEMKWQDGVLPIGLKENYIICLDEVFKIPPGVQMAMQALYERDGFLMLDEKPGSLYDKTVHPGEFARLYLTDNVKGTGDASEFFAATQAQDTSTIDRFGITVNVPYLPEVKEVHMLCHKYGNNYRGTVKRMVQFANLIREAYLQGKIALTLSPRGLFVAMDMICAIGLNERVALEYSFINKIADDSELQAIKQFSKTVWG